MLYAPSRGLRASPGVWDSAARAALPTKTPSLSLGHGIPPRNRRQRLLHGGGHFKAMQASPPCFFIFVAGLTPPVLLCMAAFLRLPIRGCLPKGCATHSPRYVVIPGIFLPCGTEEAPRLPVQEPARCPSSPHLQQHLLRSGPRQSAAMWLKPRQRKHRFTSFFLRTRS